MANLISKLKSRIRKSNIRRYLSSMRTKLTASYLVLTIMPLLFISVFVFNVSISTIKNEVSGYVANTLEQVNNNIDTTYLQLTNKLMSIGTNETIQAVLKKTAERPFAERIDDDEVVSTIIAKEVSGTTDIESLWIFSYNGEIYRLWGTNNSLAPQYLFTSTSWFKTMKKLNKRTLMIPTHEQMDLITEGEKKKVVTYINEITDLDTNKSIGFIMLEMNVASVSKNLKDVNRDTLSELVIIDDNKTVIYHTKSEYISSQFRTNYVSRIMEERTGNFIESADEQQKLVAFDTSSKTGWTVISIVPTDVLFSKIYSFEIVLIYTFLLCMLFAVIIALLMSKTLTEPISRLQSTMKQAEMGDFSVAMEITSNDEIGQLGRSFNNMLEKVNRLIRRVYQTEIARKEAQLNALQAQINPHFLYNTLQIMDIMAEDKEAYEISKACQALSKIFRYSIQRGGETVTLREELQHVKNYILIQNLRLGDKLEVVYDVAETSLNLEIIKLIIQPLVENSIVHGIESSDKKCVIKISARLQEDTMIITVEDTGRGMDEEELFDIKESLSDEHEDTSKKQGGIALINVNSRIKLYYSDRYGLSIQSKKNIGTKITLILPAKEYIERI